VLNTWNSAVTTVFAAGELVARSVAPGGVVLLTAIQQVPGPLVRHRTQPDVRRDRRPNVELLHQLGRYLQPWNAGAMWANKKPLTYRHHARNSNRPLALLGIT